MRRRFPALLVAAAALACASAASGRATPARPLTPKGVEHAFRSRGIDLVDDLIHRNGDRPVVRSYLILVRAADPQGALLVYDSPAAAAEATRLHGPLTLRRLNVVVTFAAAAPPALRRRVRVTLAALGS